MSKDKKVTRHVISKSSTKKRGSFTEEVVYKTEVAKGKFTSKTKHEPVK